jgi:hypothetical protein
MRRGEDDVPGTRIRKGLDILGKLLLAWFVFSTLIYFWSGRFFTEVEQITISVRTGSYWWAIQDIIYVFSAGFAVFLMIPFLLRGYWSGLFIALLDWVIGYFFKPVLVRVSAEWQVSEREAASGFLYVINIFWSLAMLFGILALFITKRSSTTTFTPNQPAGPH